MSQPYFSTLAVMAAEYAPQPTVAELHELEMQATFAAMSGLLTSDANTEEEPVIDEEASEQSEDSKQANEWANPKVGRSSQVKRASNKKKGG